jgi:hypothetical protein
MVERSHFTKKAFSGLSPNKAPLAHVVLKAERLAHDFVCQSLVDAVDERLSLVPLTQTFAPPIEML